MDFVYRSRWIQEQTLAKTKADTVAVKLLEIDHTKGTSPKTTPATTPSAIKLIAIPVKSEMYLLIMYISFPLKKITYLSVRLSLSSLI